MSYLEVIFPKEVKPNLEPIREDLFGIVYKVPKTKYGYEVPEEGYILKEILDETNVRS